MALSPRTSDWIGIWSQCDLIWSYYDLPSLCAEDGELWAFDDRFYHAPLGVDAFDATLGGVRPFVVCSSGRSWLTESARECALAAEALNRKVLHLGPLFNSRPWVSSISGVIDSDLAALYGQCEFVSGLRRIEGFELPVVEGLLCGARPICFDRPHYRQWFGEFAEFIPEGDRKDVLANLVRIFTDGPRPVTEEERHLVRHRFDWSVLLRGMWDRL